MFAFFDEDVDDAGDADRIGTGSSSELSADINEVAASLSIVIVSAKDLLL